MMQRFLILLFFTFASFQAVCIKPDTAWVATPKEYGLHYADLTLTTEDGYELTAWLCKADSLKSSDKCVLIFNPDAGNMSYSLDIATFINRELKADVLLFDYRGFGRSQSFTFDPNILLPLELLKDAQAAVGALNRMYPSASKLIYGKSMGAGIAMLMDYQDSVSLFLDNPFVVQKNTVEAIHSINPLKASLTWIEDDRLEPLEAINGNEKWRGVTILHAGLDRHIATEDIYTLCRKFLHPTVYIDAIAPHGAILSTSTDIYLELLRKAVGNP